MHRIKKILDIFEGVDGSLSTTKTLSIYGGVVSGLVLLYSAYVQSSDLWIIFGIFLLSNQGLTVSKGAIDVLREKYKKEPEEEKKEAQNDS